MFYWDEDKYPIGTVDTPARWGVVMLDDTYTLGPVYKLAIYEMRDIRGVGKRPVAMHVCRGFCEPGITPDAALERARQYRLEEFFDDGGVEFRWVGALRWTNPNRPVKKGRSE
jgi:hypothetical protein